MRKRDVIPLAVLALACAALWYVPGPRPAASDADDGAHVRARVTEVDNSRVTKTGLLDYGTQQLAVEVLEGPVKGRTFTAYNEIRAQLDLDKQFVPGDVAVVAMPESALADGDEPLIARDHWRNGWSLALFVGFCALLCAFGGWTGLKAIFSFVFSCLVVWKGVIPLALRGWPASWTAFAAVALLTGVIMYLVAGPTRKGLAAFLGSMLGIAAGLALAYLFGWLMHVNGATLPFAQALLYSGYESLDLQDIFIGAMVLAASGAVMDLAMDIASGIDEVALRRPELPARELFRSGIRIGRSVVGTMTTTLLLAYSGGYLTLLMVFAAQGTHPRDFLNSPIVSAEIVKTLIGSFSLVLVAPFTAAVGAQILKRRQTFQN